MFFPVAGIEVDPWILPIVAFIMLGSNDVWHPEEFEPQMRKLIEFSIEIRDNI